MATAIKIALNRTDDIEMRGKDHKVHDYNGRVVKLSEAMVWYNNDGNYVEPRSYEEKNFFSSLSCLIM